MKRICPNCSAATIAIPDLLLGDCVCRNCRSRVGVNRAASMLFSLLVVLVTVATAVMVFSLFGIYAVVVWFVFPIGAIGYLKARFCPLVAKQHPTGHGRG